MTPWGGRIGDATLALMADRKVGEFAGRRPALVAIDLYDLVYDGGPRPVRELMEEYPASCGEYAWKALPPTIEIYATARRCSVPIVHVTYDSRAETDGKIRPTNRQRRQAGRTIFTIKEELAPVDDELVVYKKRASAFFGTPLAAFLNEMGADSLVIVGESTSGCVRSSVVEVWSLGYPVAVVSECVFDRSELSHQVSLFDMHLKYATVVGVSVACDLIRNA
jgi:maleamate amidohydrolase